MTIGEAIAYERKSAKSNREAEALYNRDDFIWNATLERKRAEYHEQLAEWLEELKEARNGFEENRKAGYAHGYSDGYKKAVCEFAEKMKERNANRELSYFGWSVLVNDAIDEIAEQLKGGAV